MSKDFAGNRASAGPNRQAPRVRDLNLEELEQVVGGLTRPMPNGAQSVDRRAPANGPRRSGGFWSWLFG